MCNDMRNQNLEEVPQEKLKAVVGGNYDGCERYIDTASCIGCGDCARTCPIGAISECGGVYVISGFCIDCGNCVAACPLGCIK